MSHAFGILAGAFLLAAALLAGPPAAYGTEPPSESDRAQIRDVVARQLDAFRRDDGETAFSFASPTIRGMFGTVDGFMSMVRSGYEPVYRWHRFDFREARLVEGWVIQKVHIDAQDGSSVTAFYVMERQPDGTWRVAGCSLGAPEEQTT